MAKCPYCKEPVILDPKAGSDRKNEVFKEIEGRFKKEIMYSCPHCDSVLGFGFFIGGELTGRP